VHRRTLRGSGNQPARPRPGGGPVALAAAVALGLALQGCGGPATKPAAAEGPEGIAVQTGPVLAPASTAANGAPVDGIRCDASEQVAYHIHSHLLVFVNGQPRSLPYGIGLVAPVAQDTGLGTFAHADRCYYWLHVHAGDGIIHIESPTQQTYTLGQFFALWRQPLSSGAVGPATGAVTAYVNGKPFTGDPGTIPLKNHEDIQLDVGTPAPAPVSVDWSHARL
jgi:hypothetical protein